MVLRLLGHLVDFYHEPQELYPKLLQAYDAVIADEAGYLDQRNVLETSAGDRLWVVGDNPEVAPGGRYLAASPRWKPKDIRPGEPISGTYLGHSVPRLLEPYGRRPQREWQAVLHITRWSDLRPEWQASIVIMSAYVPLVATLDTTLPGNGNIPPQIRNLGAQPAENYAHLLRSSALLITLGTPFAPPAALEALSAGALVLQPEFSHPVKDVFRPGERSWEQHPYLRESVGPPLVYTANYADSKELQASLRSIACAYAVHFTYGGVACGTLGVEDKETLEGH